LARIFPDLLPAKLPGNGRNPKSGWKKMVEWESEAPRPQRGASRKRNFFFIVSLDLAVHLPVTHSGQNKKGEKADAAKR
jgi:hypothetical protein